MKNTFAYLFLILLLSGCSTATTTYQASGYYDKNQPNSITPTGSCQESQNSNCIPFKISWKTEEFCGFLYFGKSPEVTEKSLIVDNSLYSYQDWKIDQQIGEVFVGDDSDFVVVNGESNSIEGYLACGSFSPKTPFSDIVENTQLNFMVYCKPNAPNEKFPPASNKGYALDVKVLKAEKLMFGCD
jgi:hypothetical protein